MSKHTLSIHVVDGAGVMIRVAQVFGRRGLSIGSITASPSRSKKYAHITITTSGEEEIIDQIILQLNKLVNVLHVEKHDKKTSLRREVMLVKCIGNKNELDAFARPEAITIIDESDNHFVVQIAATPDQLDEIIVQLGQKFEITEVIRSGAVTMKTGSTETYSYPK